MLQPSNDMLEGDFKQSTCYTILVVHHITLCSVAVGVILDAVIFAFAMLAALAA